MFGKACPDMLYILFCFIKFNSYVYGLTKRTTKPVVLRMSRGSEQDNIWHSEDRAS